MIGKKEGLGGFNSIKSQLLGSAATLMACSILGVGSIGVAAQDTAADTEIDFEEVTVTGSRIVRRDLSAPSPISTVGAEEFQLTGAQNVEQVLATLPQTVPGFGSASNNPGNGTATVNLRGLGAQRTLVLVNGRRYLQSSQAGIVDLNTIPPSLIERVEVVTGGASAVYGSDAMSGVVNFVMKDDYEGFEMSGQFDTSTHGDAERYTIDATLGGNFGDGRGNATLYMNYAKRTALLQGARKFSTFALQDGCITPGSTDSEFGNGERFSAPNDCVADGGEIGLVAGGSQGIPGTRLFGGPTVDPDGIPNSGDEYVLGRFNTDGSGAAFTGADLFNYAPDNFLQLPQERWMVHGSAHYAINDNVRVYAEGTFVSNEVPTELAPTPAFTTVFINPDSPFFTSAVQDALDGTRTDTNGDGIVDGDDNAPFFIGRRMVENESRRSRNTRNGYRVLFGFDGEIADGWTYDVSYTHASVDRTNLQQNDIAASLFIQAIAVTDDGTACQDPSGGCVPLNIFGEGNISQEAIDFIKINATNVTNITTDNVMALVSGSLGDWTGAGEVGLAIGGEYRKDSSAFTPDTFLATGNVLGFNAGQATVGGFDVYEVFAEMALPLLSGAPMAESLEATLAARYSDYSTAGGVWSYAAGMTWAPIPDISFRAQYQRAVRAPSVQELFQGASNGFPGAVDPCSVSTAGVAPDPSIQSLCEATGMPAGAFGVIAQPNSQLQGLFGGNPDLTEETADTYTVGAVITPSAIPGFSMTLDYYDIKIDDAISTLGGGVNNILNICYNIVQDVNSVYCQAITRNQAGGVRDVAAFNANIGEITNKGMDLQWSYNMDVDFGFFEGGSNLSFNFVGTRVFENVTVADLNVGQEVECAGNFGQTCGLPDPKHRFNLRTTLANGPLVLSLNWRWLGGTDDDQIENNGVAASDLPVPELSAVSYFDLSFTYDLNETLQMYGGARNLFNKKPQFVGDSQSQANTFPNMYDAIGTNLFVGARVRF